ncbi:sugar 3,4-ketoisomerase [Flavobacterium difficile]|uniref:WxcM-like domain-containing protein n=1 Tax=Flavobacterium difficile TaxID=2709659 RepID=A0ABX0I373_9FLAO|nr:FdtA/QdtA family cupin domain-containing protein [Flavobacterium difficile]NHM01627.1 WxcM-like domain-containing protein [Flavobacterium difficile]
MSYKILDIPKINNTKGNIGVIENDTIPFAVKRVYYLFDVPSGAKRGGHAHKKLKQVLIAISGSFDVVLKDGKSKEIVTLNRPDKGLLIENNIWRELENFSSGSVCLVLASEEFSESDYIRSYKEYLSFVK